jgi:signal transduction histidine kinase
MLRRKFTLAFGMLLVLLIGTAVGVVWVLQGVLADLRQFDHANEAALVIQRFRWVVLGLSIVFLLLINVSLLSLLRMASMVLRPVDKLIAATRELAREHFDHRVEVDQEDEFGELAHAYNHLAEQLADNERRKLETLGQVALTLNHELNNAATIIELQLQLLSRQNDGNPRLEKGAREIRESLRRMTQTLESLKHVRRIVLTDYVSGVKMLDLERSVADPEPPPAGAQETATAH